MTIRIIPEPAALQEAMKQYLESTGMQVQSVTIIETDGVPQFDVEIKQGGHLCVKKQ